MTDSTETPNTTTNKPDDEGKSRGGRRRRPRGKRAEQKQVTESAGGESAAVEQPQTIATEAASVKIESAAVPDESSATAPTAKPKRVRRGVRGRSRSKKQAEPQTEATESDVSATPPVVQEAVTPEPSPEKEPPVQAAEWEQPEPIPEPVREPKVHLEPQPVPLPRRLADDDEFGVGIPEPTPEPPAVVATPTETVSGEEGERHGRRRRRRGRRGRGRNAANGGNGVQQGAPVVAGTDSTLTTIPPRTDVEEPLSDAEEEPEEDESTGDRVMLINVSEGEESRIAIMHDGRLEELFIERASAESHVGNIYKGRVTNVEPSIQAAFVDFGLPKNGFLHISDLQPQYFPDGRRMAEDVGRKLPRRDRPPIQKCLRRGQEVIVQVIKEGIGSKGPTLTTYISIPGRYLVMMPGMSRLGVSRRIEDDQARRKMRTVMDELKLPKDMGFILRTAGMDRSKRDLQRDLMYLQRLWKMVAQRIKHDRTPCELYQESDLIIRTIRDSCSSDFARIIVDNEATANKVRDFLAIASPRKATPVELYTSSRPLFHKYGIESEIERINDRHVPLPSGGSLIIESTEAMVTIDVNSGRFRDLDDAEMTAFRTNQEAVEEIARQLRLRDLGGLILCDLIDMRYDKHCREIERLLREALKKHKERAKCLKMSQFGIIEMTRQRMRPSIKRSIYQDCPYCRGSALVKNAVSMTLDLMRLMRLACHYEQVRTIDLRVSPPVASQLLNAKREAIYLLEKQHSRRISIHADNNLGLDQYTIECLDSRGGTVRLTELGETNGGGRHHHNNHNRQYQSSHTTPSDGRTEEHSSFEEMID